MYINIDMNWAIPFILFLFMINGLFIVFLWALNMCNLLRGYVATKNLKCLIGLVVLCLINMFYIPTVLQYEFLEYGNINLFFWIGNIIVAIVISSISNKNKWNIGEKKWILMYFVCSLFGF